MRIAAIADLHGGTVCVPECDVFIIAGDVCPDPPRHVWVGGRETRAAWQQYWLTTKYMEWERTIPAKHIVVIPGNHDWFCNKRGYERQTGWPEDSRAHFLLDEEVSIDGMRIYGTSWVPKCGDWNFQAGESARYQLFQNIPYGLDILVTHGPAFELGDMTWSQEPVGCYSLRRAIESRKPKHVIFGHIHEGVRIFGPVFMFRQSVMHHVSMQQDATHAFTFEL